MTVSNYLKRTLDNIKNFLFLAEFHVNEGDCSKVPSESKEIITFIATGNETDLRSC